MCSFVVIHNLINFLNTSYRLFSIRPYLYPSLNLGIESMYSDKENDYFVSYFYENRQTKNKKEQYIFACIHHLCV